MYHVHMLWSIILYNFVSTVSENIILYNVHSDVVLRKMNIGAIQTFRIGPKTKNSLELKIEKPLIAATVSQRTSFFNAFRWKMN